MVSECAVNATLFDAMRCEVRGISIAFWPVLSLQ
jgi:hypothetical protein